MRQIFYIAGFWIVVIIAIRLAVSFPQSLLARVFFAQFGPAPIRGEAKSAYLLRCARFGGSWFMQALLLFGVGWLAVHREASLADSPYFLTLWAVVIPILGGAALLASLYALGRWSWIRWFGNDRSKQRAQA